MPNGVKPSSAHDHSSHVSSANETETAVPVQQQSQAPNIERAPDSSKTNDSLKKGATDRAALNKLESALRFKEINDQFEDPTLRSIFESSRLEAQPAPKKPIAEHAKALNNSVQKSNGFEDQFKAKSKPQQEAYNEAIKQVKTTMNNVNTLMAMGSYGLAKNQLQAMLKQEHKYEGGSIHGDAVMTFMKGVGPDGAKATETLIKQLGFVEKMQKAGISDVQMPPTEQQLKAYFGTFKTNPSAQKTAEAKGAFKNYVEAFHNHIAKSTGGGIASDVVYAPDKTKTDGLDFKTADSWKEVTTDRKTEKTGQHAGKYINDCEGYAYLSEQLLGAAGFKVKGYVSGMQSDKRAHLMVMLEDPQGKPIVTSNEGVLDESNVKLKGKTPAERNVELLEAGWGFAGATGIPNFYIGDSSAEAQSNMVHKVKDNKLN